MKTKLKNLAAVGFVLFAVFMWAASGSSKVASEAMRAPNFAYSPPNEGSAADNGITFAIIAPSYTNMKNAGEPFRSFSNSLESETLEALTTKGYSIRGPYASRDEMVYSDKEACDLALFIEIELEGTPKTGGFKRYQMADDKIGVRFVEGTLALYGKVNLTAMEPLSGEKMWAKSVSIPERVTREFTSERYYMGDMNFEDIVKLAVLAKAGDANVANPLTEVLEESFDDIMSQIWRHLDPREFERMMPKIKKLKGM
ncbi:MAG: hypothetical protein D6722_09835 [Bacteroidetes bacterium]|nr:MAG: hypothetical protein D6722_09835 [Bacteroidota bacterium]